MTASDLPPALAAPAFLDLTTPRDASWRRVLIMALAGPAAAMVVGLAAMFGLFAAAAWAGTALNVMAGELANAPRLILSSVYLLEVGLGLAAAAAGLLLAARVIFKRPLRTWITAAPSFRWGLLAWGLAAGALALLALTGLSAFLPDNGEMAPILDPLEPPDLKLIYVAASLTGFMIAAWAEEVVFRGYLLQQMSALTHRLWLVLLLNGAVFAAFHLEFDPGALAARALVGMVFAWSALRLGGLEFAIGCHAAQNLGVALFGEVLLPTSPEAVINAQDMGLEILLAAMILVSVEGLHRRRAATSAAAGLPSEPGP